MPPAIRGARRRRQHAHWRVALITQSVNLHSMVQGGEKVDDWVGEHVRRLFACMV